MRNALFSGVLLGMGVLGVVAFVTYQPPVNPDPNHTHVDFAVWMDVESDVLEKLNFSSPEFMSESESEETDDDHEAHGHQHHPYLHLHDGNGHVIHRHKPGLTIGDFFASIGAKMIKGPIVERGETLDTDCFEWTMNNETNTRCSGEFARMIRMFVNGQEVEYDPGYVFEDLDQIVIIHAQNDDEIQTALKQMTDDACLYSKTCPERGEPPTENCLADPAVPCVAP